MQQASLNITAAHPDPAVLDLPWHIPLVDWPKDIIAALPRGISRHIVRFIRMSGRVIAIKEIGEVVAYHEYEQLRALRRLEVPSVEPLAVITGRQAPDGSPLEAVLITEHLQFSLPYRSLFSNSLRPDTATRFIDALAVLLVRLHLVGFYWGDVSLSNTLFRRDAGEFAAYLVDAETGRLYPELTEGQREYDLEVARVNIIGVLMDLEAGDALEPDLDPLDVGTSIDERYRELWAELTAAESISAGERWRMTARIERLNRLGFDVGELDMITEIDGTTVVNQPKVVDAGHHSRRLLRLTGLDAEENQARRLLNDLDEYRAATDRQNEDQWTVAHDWLEDGFGPVITAVQRDCTGKLEPAQIFHELLDHRWFVSQREHRDVPLPEAVHSYIDTVLRHRPYEQAVVEAETGDLPRVIE